MTFTIANPDEWPERKKPNTLRIGNVLRRKRKEDERVRYEWAIVRDVIRAAPAPDKSEYVAVLCEGINEHAGQWFVWRLYFTPNRLGKLAYGQFAPQAPIAIDKWLSEEVFRLGWYRRL